jgi:hypothetical protein
LQLGKQLVLAGASQTSEESFQTVFEIRGGRRRQID